MTSSDQMIDTAATDAALGATAAGRVRGSVADGIRVFLGVPYAAPPVGDNRFAPPRPVVAWEGERDATAPGPCAPQRLKPFPQLDVTPLIGDGGTRGDDYLTLNIWAPVAASNAPVMVFIHGGGFVIGSKDAPVSDGTGFARSGVVCVAINYRMGIDGFLPIPGVPTNLGLRDMLAALAWVKANIAHFGGDPGNVTVFGESAGAMAIAALVASPLAAGLFQRAIIESGHGAMVRDIGVAQRLVKKLAKILRITPDAAGFARRDIDTVFDAIEKLARLDLRDAAGHEPVFGISRFIPVFGDDVLPEPPIAALGKGAGAAVDVLIGTNAEEMRLYFVPTGVNRKMFGWLARWIVGKSNPHARAALKAYGMGKKGVSAGAAFFVVFFFMVFRWTAWLYAAVHQGRQHVFVLV